MNKLILVIRLRGIQGVPEKIYSNLKTMGLHRRHSARIVRNSLINQGIIKKIKDYTTWGYLSESFDFEKLVEAKKLLFEENLQNELLNDKVKSFGLNSPRKGLRSIKKPYNRKGDLGFRPDIQKLVLRML